MTTNKFVFAFVHVLALASCGDNRGEAQPPDARPALDAPPSLPPRAVIVSGDFVTPGPSGVMAMLDLETMQVTEHVAPAGAIGNDPMVRQVGNELYVVNRAGGNNVTILDATTFALVEQIATGAGSNPQDVAVVGNKLYVPGLGTAGVVVATRGSTTTSTIDLSLLDPDGKPDCISAFHVAGEIYVACEMLDGNFTARGPGKVVVIDPSSDTVKTTITMANTNPFGVFEKLPDDVLGGDLVIPTVEFGNFAVGCVERIQTGAGAAANGCVVTNQDLGGYVSRIDAQKVGLTPMLWMVTSNGEFGPTARSRLKGFDLELGTLWADPVTPEGQLLIDAVGCGSTTIVVADQTMASNGLRVYEGNQETTTTPLPIGLRPGSGRGLVCYQPM